MRTEENLKEMFGRENPFKVPENYFETLADNIISQLPEESSARVVKMSVWKKYRVHLLAAACVLSVLFSAGIYVSVKENTKEAQVFDKTRVEVAETTIEAEDAFDEMADYVMIDKEDMYAYISGE
ncbi:MAG: hypothetical protein IJJ68_09300 [Prevotella sp.]|jgi:hypothetical protein|nr:hypothetical protein [Prevotella sp.]MBR4369329.1 hypothetical protein [Prevotella sp.]MBR7048784.1 hypothetical protein [Prevotella sp.]